MRAAMAHRRIADHAGELGQRRQRLLHDLRVRHLDMRASSRRSRSSGPCSSMPVRPSIWPMSMSCGRLGEPQLHHRQQRMAAGEELRLRVLGQQVDRLPDRGRAVIVEFVHRSRLPLFCCLLHLRGLADRRPDRLRRRRHGQILGADRVGDGVDDRRRRRDRARLAAALDAERIATGISSSVVSTLNDGRLSARGMV